MPSTEEAVNDSLYITIFGTTVSVLTLGLTLLLAAGGVMLMPFVLKYERVALEESHQFQQGKTALVMTLAEEYRDLDVEIAQSNGELAQALRNQQDTIKSRLKREASLMKDVPETVKEILNEQ